MFICASVSCSARVYLTVNCIYVGVAITTTSAHTNDSNIHQTPTEPGTEVYCIQIIYAWCGVIDQCCVIDSNWLCLEFIIIMSKAVAWPTTEVYDLLAQPYTCREVKQHMQACRIWTMHLNVALSLYSLWILVLATLQIDAWAFLLLDPTALYRQYHGLADLLLAAIGCCL